MPIVAVEQIVFHKPTHVGKIGLIEIGQKTPQKTVENAVQMRNAERIVLRSDVRG